jgi:hypothetical protein
MPPQDQKRLAACSAEIAEILYRNSDPEGLKSLDGIEQTVRQTTFNMRIKLCDI